MKQVLVTGGLGYIGSHAAVALFDAGYEPILLDNLANADKTNLARIAELCGRQPMFYEADFADKSTLERILADHPISAVIHFAAHKYVGESVEKPLKYFGNNVSGFVSMLELLQKENIPLVLSSSAAVYGTPAQPQVTEDTPANPLSPYGWSKWMDEVILASVCAGEKPLRGVALRYFNVVGAHGDSKLGDSPKSASPMLLPIMIETALGKRQAVDVHGSDYPTPDGTCLRDYVHVVDLAEAHVVALEHMLQQPAGYSDVFNVGTGQPTSVLEMIRAFEQTNKVKVPYKVGPRRAGDSVAYYAVTDKIRSVLGWKSKKTVEDACRDAWRWANQAS